MAPEFQEVFNLNKGSIPVRLGMKMDKFDDCAKLSAKDFVGHRQDRRAGAVASPTAWPCRSAVEGAIKDVVSQFWNTDKMTRQGRDGQASPPPRRRK